MQPSQPPPTDTAHCPICRARLEPALPFCPVCGAQLDDFAARDEEELRGVLYLLSELEHWAASGRVAPEKAAELRAIYEQRRDELRDELAARRDEKLKPHPATTKEAARPAPTQTVGAGTEQAQAAQSRQPQPEESAQQHTGYAPRESEFVAFPARPHAPPRFQSPPFVERPQRTLLERLADPRTLRLLLYTGAAMLVVGVVIWLRDLLYLKLQEPVVQAGLLAFGTAAFIASGWYTILRTRQRWTGRALTLAGSLLFPVNFWFLVRSGLIENQGRGWVVGLFCALLYAQTAALLRERLYVYLSCLASLAALWALILRDAPRAFGLYALSLMTLSLVFLHLSQLAKKEKLDEEEARAGQEGEQEQEAMGRWSYELWGVPLVHTSLAFAALAVLIYMPLRVAADAPYFYDGIFRLRSSAYDPGVALVILAAAVYVLWFAGRFVYEKQGTLFYTLSALLFFLTVWAACDALGLSAQAVVFSLAMVTFAGALVARSARSPALSQPLYYSSLLAGVPLAVMSVLVVLNSSGTTATHSAGLLLIALSFVALSGARGSESVKGILAHLAALYFSASYFVGLGSASLDSVALNTLLAALWPLVLFGASELLAKLKREPQLQAPFTRIADFVALLLLLWGSLLSLIIHLMSSGGPRSSAIVSLGGVVVYGAVRALRSRSGFGAALGTLAATIMTAAVLDALQRRGMWPASWPIAAGVVVFALLLEGASALRALRSRDETEELRRQSLIKAARMVLDAAVLACAVLWLGTAFTLIGAGGFAAPAVLLPALLYWGERAWRVRSPWPVRVACAHLAAFVMTLHIALRVEPEWLTLLFTLTVFPIFFILSRYTSDRAEWLRAPLSEAAATSLALSLSLALIHAAPHLRAGDARLLAPSMTTGAIALLSLAASIFSRGSASVLYFRTGLWVAVLTLMLASLRAGFDPLSDVEIYSTPIAILILIIAYLSHRRAWEDYDRDVGALLWLGSLLLCAPLLLRSVEFRVLLDSAAPWRDVAVLTASLALVLYGVVGRMRAPVMVGSVTLVTELVVITLTTVDWLQVPLKYYLITVGALILIIFGTLEYRREQVLRLRQRFQERRESAREQFRQWR